jgi:hypothetical protein
MGTSSSPGLACNVSPFAKSTRVLVQAEPVITGSIQYRKAFGSNDRSVTIAPAGKGKVTSRLLCPACIIWEAIDPSGDLTDNSKLPAAYKFKVR